MNALGLKRYLIVLILAAIPSLAVIRTHRQSNVPFCIEAAGCDASKRPKGTITNRAYGYPLAYRANSQFVPVNRDRSKPDYAGYASAQVERQGLSLPSILMNIIFWFALLNLAFGWLISNFLSRQKEKTVASPTEQTLHPPASPVER